MSGLVSALPGPLATIASGNVLAGFQGLLQEAFWRGIPFSVVGSQVRKSRRFAVHQYPFRDGGWAEDMGRGLRTYSFTGYLSGDSGPLLQLALDAAAEAPGPGLLIHPTIGAVNVAMLSCATAVRKDRMRVIEVAFEFIEAGGPIFPSVLIATAIQTLAAASSALTSMNADLGTGAGAAAAAGTEPVVEGTDVITAFADAVTASGFDPTAILGMTAGLQPPDANTTYGRYANGSASTMLPTGTTVGDLQAQLAAQRTAMMALSATLIVASTAFSATTDMMTPASALLEALRAGIVNPADQVRVMLNLATFAYIDGLNGGGIAGDMATVRDAMSEACRRAALVSLANASAAYQPVSYDDAINVRDEVVAALDVEILAAGDMGQDLTYSALIAVRAAIIQDLTTRGGSLPNVITVTLPAALPSLTIAQRLYQDASRSDQIAAEAGVPHPAFCPTVFQVLSR